MTDDRTVDNMTAPPERSDVTNPQFSGVSDVTNLTVQRLNAGVIIGKPLWPLSPAPKRWVGYVRVSTEAQARDGDGLEVQVDQILGWARERGDVVCAVYGDPGVSGAIASLPDRKGFWQMIDDAGTVHRADGVIVAKLDRLSRDFIGQEMLLMDLRGKWRLDVRSSSTAENEALDGDGDPQRKLMRQILGIFAEYERATIKNRMVLGRRRKIAKGGYGGGVVSYGVQVVDGELVDHPVERRFIGIGLTMRAMGVSYDAIAQYFIESGFLTKRGGMWDRRTVRWALTSVEGKIAPQKLDALAEDYVTSKRGDTRYRAGHSSHHSGNID